MYCTKCGREIPNDSRFCQYCGKEITTKVENEKNIEEDTSKLFAEVLKLLHEKAKEINVARNGCIFIPELSLMGEKIAKYFLDDKFLIWEFNGNEIGYNNVLMALCLQTGIVLASKWNDDYSGLDDDYISELLMKGPTDDASVILNNTFNWNEDKSAEYYELINRSVCGLLEFKSDNIKISILTAGFLLGVSTVLCECGYGEEAKREASTDANNDKMTHDQASIALVNYATNIVSENKLSEEDGTYRIITEVFQPKDFLPKVLNYCKTKYAQMGERKIRGELIVTSYYGAICSVLFYNRGKSGIIDMPIYDYLDSKIDMEFTDISSEKMLGISENKEKVDEIWNIISSYVNFSQVVFAALDELDDKIILEAMHHAYLIGNLVGKKYGNSNEECNNIDLSLIIENNLSYINKSEKEGFRALEWKCLSCGKKGTSYVAVVPAECEKCKGHIFITGTIDAIINYKQDYEPENDPSRMLYQYKKKGLLGQVLECEKVEFDIYEHYYKKVGTTKYEMLRDLFIVKKMELITEEEYNQYTLTINKKECPLYDEVSPIQKRIDECYESIYSNENTINESEEIRKQLEVMDEKQLWEIDNYIYEHGLPREIRGEFDRRRAEMDSRIRERKEKESRLRGDKLSSRINRTHHKRNPFF